MRLYVVFCNNRRTSEIIEAPLGKPQDTNSAVFLTLFKNLFEHLVRNICRFNDHTPSRFLQFLSDPSPIIGYACHSLTDSLTHSLTNSRLVKLIDMNLVCEKGNSKHVEVTLKINRICQGCRRFLTISDPR